MSAADGFLSRWSRRKLRSGKRDGEERPSPAAEAGAGSQGEGEAGSEPARVDALSAEEVATLPRLEELTADTDLTLFLRAGVPALLRKEALRRMWSLDPAIRDFVGEARDYSYDWNVAGGVPVSGPLLPGDDVDETLGRMFSRLRDEPQPEERPTVPEARTRTPAKDDALRDDVVRSDETPGHGSPDGLPARLDVPPPQAATASLEDREVGGREEVLATRIDGARHRRHGSALPKFDSF